MIRRRKSLISLGVLAVLVAVFAAASVAGTAGPNKVAVANGAKSRAASHSTLIDAVPDDATGFDLIYGGSDTSNETTMNSYDTFTGYQFFKPHNGVSIFNPAAVRGIGLVSWKNSKDGRTWTLRVRPAKFASGRAVTAADVKYTIDRDFGAQGSAAKFVQQFLGRINAASDLQVVNAHTLTLKTTSPNPLLPYLFSISTYCILDSKTLLANPGPQGWAQDFIKHQTVGSGPYTLSSWTPGTQVVLKANSHYWRGAPPLKTVIMRVVPSAANQVALLKRGSVDMAERLTPAQIHALKGAPHVKVVSVPFASQVALVMDNKSKPFDDVRVRRAMAYAIPYANIIKNVFFGLAKPTAGPVATQFPGHYQKGYPYGKQNLAKAKSLLAAAGYPNGFSVNLSVSSGYPVHQPMAVLIRDALSKIGVRVNIQTLTPAVFQQQTGQHAINFFLQNYIWWVPDPAYAMALGYACGQFFNYANWCNKTFDDKLNTAFGENNKKKRTAEMAQLQKIAWTDMPVVWIVQPNVNVAMRDNVTGYHLMNDGITRFSYIRKK